MRIRKNAKLSPLLFSAVESVPEVLQTHICQLNQSPWDVIPLRQHDTNQLGEVEDSFNENASLGDSIGAVESVASMMEESAKLSNNNSVITNGNEVMADKDGDYCEDLDENGDGFEKLVDSSLKCKKQFKEEDYSSFSSDHHLRRSLLRSSENNYYSTLNNCSIAKKSAAGGMVSRRMRPARSSKKAASVAAGGSNPYEFYYYSGFGPLWGKKRRERGGEEDGGKSSENTTGIRSNVTTPSPSDVEELDYVEDYDDDEEEEEDGDGDGGKKRMRKPVKARSLKSLM
ncbi:unnamed protein product [Citrullus colocynthis]|uniref:Uncharacterized protein n=1 Tax=Citrullus colocynthis TaxID=252529 RepID=A0ABP0Z7R5_9ROSI